MAYRRYGFSLRTPRQSHRDFGFIVHVSRRRYVGIDSKGAARVNGITYHGDYLISLLDIYMIDYLFSFFISFLYFFRCIDFAGIRALGQVYFLTFQILRDIADIWHESIRLGADVIISKNLKIFIDTRYTIREALLAIDAESGAAEICDSGFERLPPAIVVSRPLMLLLFRCSIRHFIRAHGRFLQRLTR